MGRCLVGPLTARELATEKVFSCPFISYHNETPCGSSYRRNSFSREYHHVRIIRVSLLERHWTSVLGEVTIVNRDDEGHTVDFRVKWGEKVVHRSTYKLTARTDGQPDGAVPERTWPSDAGQFTVSARKEGDDWQTVDPADRDYPDCYGVYVDINENEDWRYLPRRIVTNAPTRCSNRDGRQASPTRVAESLYRTDYPSFYPVQIGQNPVPQ